MEDVWMDKFVSVREAASFALLAKVSLNATAVE